MNNNILPFKKLERDEVLDIGELAYKDFGSNKFIFACYNIEGDLVSFISSDLSDKDLCYIIQTLQDRRNIEFSNIQ